MISPITLSTGANVIATKSIQSINGNVNGLGGSFQRLEYCELCSRCHIMTLITKDIKNRITVQCITYSVSWQYQEAYSIQWHPLD